MATQSVEFTAPPNQTLTVRLFSAGSDTIVATAGTVTAATNRAGIYTAAFTDVPAGRYRLIATNAAGTPLANWWTDLTLTTATFPAYEMPMSLVQTIGQASIDEIGSDFLAHVLTKGSSGTIENTLWKISKTNASAEGQVDDATPTASQFTTNLTGPADEYNGQVLVFTSGSLTGEARPIDDCTESGGVLTLTMQRPFTSAPADEDEFLILPQQVYSIASIQAGLALASELAKVPKSGETRRYTQVANNTGNKTADVSIGAPL
jgi:hypothetical protein